MRRLVIQILIALSFLGVGAYGHAQPGDVPVMEEIPSLVVSVRVTPPLDFCGEPVPLNTSDARERLEKELLIMLWDRAQTILWIKRSSRYMPYIQSMLKANNLPDDLKYIPIIESSLRALAGSPKGAVGYWQFIRDTGERYGLGVTEDMDERRNIMDSTQAAITYLKKLHDDFGSWTLAAAAYNMGEQGLKREIQLQDTSDFYNLYLYQETQRYVFRILAAKLILSNPEKYGFFMAPEDLYPPLEYDRVSLNLPQRTPVLSIARAAQTTFKAIRDLNPEIRGHYLPKGYLTISIPKGTSAGFQERLNQQLQRLQVQVASDNVYVVKNGDSLSKIAARQGIPVSLLRQWNHLRQDQPIHPGDRLILHSN